MSARKHRERVGDNVIVFSQSSASINHNNIRDPQRRTQAKRILTNAGLTDYKVVKKTINQIVVDTGREYYDQVLKKLDGDVTTLKQQIPYTKFISGLFRLFCNLLFDVSDSCSWEDAEVRTYMTVLRRNPDSERYLYNHWYTFLNKPEGVNVGVHFAQQMKEKDVPTAQTKTSAKMLPVIRSQGRGGINMKPLITEYKKLYRNRPQSSTPPL